MSKPHNKEKYPEIWEAKEKRESMLTSILEKRKIYTDKIATIQLKIAELKNEKEDLNKLAMKDASRLKAIRSEIARMARAMGAVVAK